MPSPSAVAALSALPTEAAALLAHNSLLSDALAVAGVLVGVLTTIPALADTWMRWQAHRMWLEFERRRLRALDQIETPQGVLERLPPPTWPFGGQSTPAAGPAPPAALPGHAAAGSGGRTG